MVVSKLTTRVLALCVIALLELDVQQISFGLDADEKDAHGCGASTGQSAYAVLQREPCDGVILDLMLPDGDGL